MQVLNCFDYPSIFVDAGENLTTINDVVTPLNPLIAPVEQKELEKTPLDVNVSQQSRTEKPSKKVVRTRVDCSAWDC
jgi:hypothetical protein